MIRILKQGEYDVRKLLMREETESTVGTAVAEILRAVKTGGDRALLDYCEKFDKVRPAAMEVSQAETDAALDAVPADFLSALRAAAENIRAYHALQKQDGYELKKDGITLRRRVLPLDRVGLYIPGGTAAYPSTVLMNAIPAKIAGVRELIMVSPPTCGGSIAPAILAAAKIAGVDRIFRIGGAQAVAALAYGTESVPQVDKIVGPGNAYVAEAKRQVFGTVGIDMIAGPSEILVLADGSGDARIIAADLLSQAEHDKMATAVLLTPDAALAEAVRAELERQAALLPRAEIVRASIENNGKIVLTDSIEQAIDLANRLAPEHLELYLDNAEALADRIVNAGSVFVGKFCPEPLGDYFCGTNHTLPTSGTARFASPLSVDDFVKKMSYTFYTESALADAKDKIAVLARQEKLEAHARSVLSRFE